MSSCKRNQVCIKPITEPIQHAEGPHWDSKNSILYYVDTFKATALRYNEDFGTEAFKLDKFKSIGIVIPIKNDENKILVAADRTFLVLDLTYGKCNVKVAKVWPDIEEDKPNNQFNDGKADCNGNLWIGTLTRKIDLGVQPHGGSLYNVVFENDELDIIEKVTETSISNGIAWNKANTKMYFVDSPLYDIVQYDFDKNTEELSNKKVIFNLKNYKNYTGIMDGMTIDSNDNLWVAMFGDGCILQINSNNGSIMRVLKMPVSHVTSVAFGGVKMDTLYATTSRLRLTSHQLTSQPNAGSVFAITGLGVKGITANSVNVVL